MNVGDHTSQIIPKVLYCLRFQTLEKKIQQKPQWRRCEGGGFGVIIVISECHDLDADNFGNVKRHYVAYCV